MMISSLPPRRNGVRRILRIAAPLTVVFFIYILFPDVIADALLVVSGAAVVAFLAGPLVRLFEKRLNRRMAALFSLLTFLIGLALAVWFLLPPLLSEFSALAKTLPESLRLVRSFLTRTGTWLESHFGIHPTLSGLSGQLPILAAGTLRFAGNLANTLYKLSLMVVLGYFFLCDREKLLLRLELLIPSSIRRDVVRMGNAVCRELKVYLRGQGLISALVGLLSAIGLAIVGVRSAAALGMIIGLLNMVPYFGPIIGGIPAVLMALSGGITMALRAAAVLWLVQQLDGMLISPRIMSGLTGISPACVLLAVFIGSGIAGIAGMLLAVPCVMTFRTAYRFLVQRPKNV